MASLYPNWFLFLDDDLLGRGAVFAGGHEEVDAVGFVVDVVSIGVGAVFVDGLKLVDECASHVVDLDFGLAAEVVEHERHLAVVGVGDDIEVVGS